MFEDKGVRALVVLSAVFFITLGVLSPPVQSLRPPSNDLAGLPPLADVPFGKILHQYYNPSYYVMPSDRRQLDELKRDFHDKYLKFSRNEEEKRGNDKNFLRFGRAGSPQSMTSYDSSDASDEEKRSEKNFLRFGRPDSQKNFIRFGRWSPPEIRQGSFGDSDSEESEELTKRTNSKNFIRFGKAGDRNFLRFGRATEDTATKSCGDNCDARLPPKVGTPDRESETRSRRKRSLSAFYDDILFMDSPSPLKWVSEFAGLGPPDSENEFFPTNQKRGRNFLRYGRDPLDLHFLRFGKRSFGDRHPDEEDDWMMRFGRSKNSKNFIRFG